MELVSVHSWADLGVGTRHLVVGARFFAISASVTGVPFNRICRSSWGDADTWAERQRDGMASAPVGFSGKFLAVQQRWATWSIVFAIGAIVAFILFLLGQG